MSQPGVFSGEEKIQLTAAEQKLVRARSLALLGKTLAPVRIKLAVTVFLVIFSVLLSTAMPLVISYGIDSALPELLGGNSAPAYLTVLVYLGLALLSGFSLYGNVLLTTQISQSALYSLRQSMFAHSQKLSISFHESYTSGRVISRLTSDLDTLKNFLDSGLSHLAATLLSMLFTAIALVSLNWQAGLALVLTALPLYFLTRWFRKNSTLAYRAQRTVSAQLISQFVETTTGIRAVKAFSYEASSRRAYGDLAEDYRIKVMDAIKINGTYMPGIIAIANLFLAAVLVLGGYAVLGGSMQAGTLLALTIYAMRIFEPVMSLSDFYNQFQSAVSALEKVSAFLAQEPEILEPSKPALRTQPASGQVDFRAVEFGYAPGSTALERLDLHIPAGQKVALVGRTGAGKSTIAKLLARFYNPDSGQILLDGVNIKDLADAQLRKEVVMLTQESFIFRGTVAENIRLSRPSATDAEVEQAARAVGAHDFISALPQGYDTALTQRGGPISAGQGQLIAFARAFLVNPALLILDEATASLDLPTEALVQDALEKLLAGRTSLVIAHRLSTVLGADRVLVVDSGRLIEDGSPAELKTSGGVFAEMVATWDRVMTPNS